MEFELKQLGPTSLYVKSAGRLDMDSAAEYRTKIKDYVKANEISNVTLDFSEITFVSSMGLKVVLEIYQAIKEPGEVIVTNAHEQIKNAFHMVGFERFITIN